MIKTALSNASSGVMTNSKNIEYVESSYSIQQSQELLFHVDLDCLYHSNMKKAFDIAEWVKEARSHWGRNQEALGELMGKTKGNVSAWENGRHEPSFNQILQISQITGWPIPDLNQKTKLTAVPYSQPPTPIDYDTLRDAIKFAIEDSETFRDKFSPELMARFIVMYYQLFKEDKKQLEKTKIDTILQLMAA